MQFSLLGWNERFAALFIPYIAAGLKLGRVLQKFNSIYTVGTESGEVRAQLSGHLCFSAATGELHVTGDWVALRLAQGNGSASVVTIKPATSRESDVIVLPCRGLFEQGITLCHSHCACPGAPALVRQLRGPRLSTRPWCNRRSSMAVTAALSPSNLPQSSTGRFDVISVLARS